MHPVTVDPLEGLDAAGFIVTGADVTRIPVGYRNVVAHCAKAVEEGLHGDLHGLYLYGSVATGQAAMPRSDVDLYAVVMRDAALDMCGRIAVQLTDHHRSSVRDIGIARYTLEYVRTHGEERCFLKHYCVPVAGIDLRPGFARCRPSAFIARAFIGDLAAAAPRGLLRSAAILFSFVEGNWSTARERGAGLIAARAPRHADTVHNVLANKPVNDDAVNELRCWLIGQMDELLGSAQ